VRGRILRLGAIAVAVIAITIVLASFARQETPNVVVAGNDGRIAAIPLGDASSFSFRYTHSVYERPVVETFEVDDRGGFALVEVRSPAEKALDYYGVEGSRSSEGSWRRLSVDEPLRLTELPMIATPKGRRTLVVGDRQLRLYNEEEATHVTICIGPGRGCS
jgi:Domain of unknown function (DUF1850)